MIARIKLINNQKEVEESHKQIQLIESENLKLTDGEAPQPVPEPVEPTFGETEMSFALSDVDYAYKGNDGMINIEHKKNAFKIIYDSDVWEKITAYFRNKDYQLA